MLSEGHTIPIERRPADTAIPIVGTEPPAKAITLADVFGLSRSTGLRRRESTLN